MENYVYKPASRIYDKQQAILALQSFNTPKDMNLESRFATFRGSNKPPTRLPAQSPRFVKKVESGFQKVVVGPWKDIHENEKNILEEGKFNVTTEFSTQTETQVDLPPLSMINSEKPKLN